MADQTRELSDEQIDAVHEAALRQFALAEGLTEGHARYMKSDTREVEDWRHIFARAAIAADRAARAAPAEVERLIRDARRAANSVPNIADCDRFESLFNRLADALAAACTRAPEARIDDQDYLDAIELMNDNRLTPHESSVLARIVNSYLPKHCNGARPTARSDAGQDEVALEALAAQWEADTCDYAYGDYNKGVREGLRKAARDLYAALAAREAATKLTQEN